MGGEYLSDDVKMYWWILFVPILHYEMTDEVTNIYYNCNINEAKSIKTF